MGPKPAAIGNIDRWAVALALGVLSLGLLGCHRAADAEPVSSTSATASAGETDRSKAASAKDAGSTTEPSTPITEIVHGKVVWLDEALQRLYGIATEPAAAQTQVVLETADGHLLPLLPDTRGRAFVVDPRLRDIELEMLVRHSAKVPLLQVIRVFRTTAEGRVEIDYWCDICAISMFILKDCECCQGPTRLREQPVGPDEGRPAK